MMNSYVFTYHGAGVRAIHRSMAGTVTLTNALSSVGFRCVGLPCSTDCNPKMETDRADKTGLVSRWWIISISHQIYLILIYEIQHLLLFLMLK